ncbi:hypothetical protein EDB92DRAFT_1943460 [Lactarius akahatsu]|uniref:Uncharacterized protein n=1 Tax=Lactarius akahatsu TaxID=416441 RepID=A0AAD4LQJ2_9AGAM|nr:hypothetical protein EDB92DRAFT_1943460 [Lactarius akahatsu]
MSPSIRRLLSTLNTTTTTAALEPPAAKILGPEELHACYVREMHYIYVTHTLRRRTRRPRWRLDRAYRMRLHSEALDIHAQIFQKAREDAPTEGELRTGLPVAWKMWCWAQHRRDKDKEFIDSFSLIVLGVVLTCLKRLGGLSEA